MRIEKMKRYIGDFIVVNEASTAHNVPNLWREVFNNDDEKARVGKAIDMWSEVYRDKLSSLLATFDKSLTQVDLIQSADGLAILYTFTVNDELRYYIGKSPKEKSTSPDTQAFFDGLPEDFVFFYKNIHNGWYEVVSEAMGLTSIENFVILSEQDWGILDTIKINFSLDKVVSVFSNGAGGYLCWDYNHAQPSGLVWWNDEAPDTGVDFWDVLDEWATMGIDES